MRESSTNNKKTPNITSQGQWGQAEDSFPSFLLKTLNCNYASILSHLPLKLDPI